MRFMDTQLDLGGRRDFSYKVVFSVYATSEYCASHNVKIQLFYACGLSMNPLRSMNG